MRKHEMILAVAASVSLALGGVTAANADDPEQDKARVEQQLAEAKGNIQESTDAVALAAAALQEVDDQLAVARDALASAQGQLDTAQAEDQRLADDLAIALGQERLAEETLGTIQAEIATDEAILAGLARSVYQGSQLSHVSALLESTSFSDYTRRSEGVLAVLRSQSGVVDSLADDRARQATTQVTLEAVRERVAQARADAAANLVEKQRLEEESAAAAAAVERLHTERATVLADAQSSLAADEAEYRALEAERSRLEQLLAERRRRRLRRLRLPPGRAPLRKAPAGAQSGVFYRPVSGWITSPYGMRVHPITGVYKLHDGTDFGAACGTPIRAAASGTVLRAGYAGGYGNQTVIEHGNIGGRYVATSYNHQSRFGVSPGQRVDRGQVIGYVGTTGYSTGCHLHFMVYVNGVTTDPMNYL